MILGGMSWTDAFDWVAENRDGEVGVYMAQELEIEEPE